MIRFHDLFRAAEARVLASPRLKGYAEVLLADWPEAEAHWQWVLTASEDDLVAWAQEADVRGEEEEERARG